MNNHTEKVNDMRIIFEDKERWITFACKEAKMQKNGFKSVKPLSWCFLKPI